MQKAMEKGLDEISARTQTLNHRGHRGAQRNTKNKTKSGEEGKPTATAKVWALPRGARVARVTQRLSAGLLLCRAIGAER
jgi:hypothetical protein